ncbi:RHS repeat-associated protein [Catenuloplanes nepalensis]|uniref:RHS repeat-associated protein n=1 Tax=Catenuloplanes nepalensis TaxID=587533 RepID=A0ABT9MMP0_9ACTN|nr:RHS repeat-associated core domain-containing protein [Catenuloplanes nepalensis]MDP9792701.1 RHS repeat-associated protein [Catenuloplanes nepalensis]
MELARHRWRATAGGLTALMVAALLTVPGSVSITPPERLQGQVEPVDANGREVGGASPVAEPATRAELPDPVWPAAKTAAVRLPAGQARVRAGDLPVTVARATGTVGERLSADLTVEVIDRNAVPESLRDGVVVRVTEPKRSGGAASVSVDYDRFGHAYGGGWADRLRLWELPECALTTPAKPGCAAVPLPTRNDGTAGTVTGEAELRSAGVLLAVAAAPTGSSGDFTATSLSASSSWSAGTNTGNFSWQYGIDTPPIEAGPQPSLAVSYSSGSADGRSSATNNQPGWLGEGFDLGAGFVERKYVGCADDTDGGASNGEDFRTGDLCWRSDNAILSLNGSSSELIYETGKGWHSRSEDGSKVEKLLGAANGDDNGEHWRLTTAAGTQYYFGLAALPGQSAATNSAWTVPVYGNHANEPCRADSKVFKDSVCDQAWRWNLDYVVDTRGNTLSYWYDQEKNQYATRATDTENVDYVRGGTLARIDYGTWDRGATDRSVTPAAQVVFSVADRCLADCGDDDSWPDVPRDQECKLDATECAGDYSPTFWSTKRLAKVTTKVWDTTKTTPAWQDVSSWTFTQSFPDPHDGTAEGLWLDRIVRAGHVGGTVTMPPVTFTPVPKVNRVLTATNQTNSWQRLARVTSETGAFTDISYTEPECTDTNKPASAAANTMLCYPVIGPDPYDPTGDGPDITEWWHKYLVTKVIENDTPLTDYRSPSKVTTYTYEGEPAWHYADDDGFIEAKRKTWNQFRGYAGVSTEVGSGSVKTLSRTTYFRGMHGDRAAVSGGTRTVSVGATIGAAVPDEDAFSGMVRETTSYNGSLDRPVSKTVNVPWQSAPTASRTINGDTVTARFVKTAITHTATAIGLDRVESWRTGRTETKFDSTYGTPDWVQDDGDTTVTGDETCQVTVYNRNTDRNLVSLAKRVTKTALPCGTAPTAAVQVLSDSRTSYDGATSPDTAPTFGSLSKVERMSAWTPAGGTQWQTMSESTYDVFGRPRTNTDVKGNVTTTAYTPANGGLLTSSVTTNHLGWTEKATRAPYWGVPIDTTDWNAQVTTVDYDPMGRVAAVWRAGRPKDANKDTPNSRFEYVFAADRTAYPYVKTQALNAKGKYVTSYEIFDGQLRSRQKQSAGVGGGRVVTDTRYDEYGRVEAAYGAHAETGTPSGTLWGEPEWSIPTVTRTEYDLAGRATASILLAGSATTNQVEKWRTTTEYAGDRTMVTPAEGATPTTTIVDFQGRTTELRHHTTAAGVDGAYTSTSYRYDAAGKLTRVIDTKRDEWIYTFDLLGRLTSAKDPDKGESKSAYNAFDELTTTTDARGEVLAYTYDSLGRQTGLYDDTPTGNARATWTYDKIYGNSGTVRGQVTESTRYDSGRAYSKRIFGFTSSYAPTSVDYVIPSGEAGLNGTYTFTYAYSQYDGSPMEITYPAVGAMPKEKVTTGYDEVTGLPVGLTTNLASAGTYVTSQAYTAFSEPTVMQRKVAGGVYVEDTTTYDTVTRRVSGSTAKPETSTGKIADVAYEYDDAGNIIWISDRPAVGAADTQCFAYDLLGRLTTAWTPQAGPTACGTAPSLAALGGAAPYWTDWTFDDLGNRRSQTTHAAAGNTTTTYALPEPGAGVVRPHAVTGTTTTAPGAAPAATSYTYDAMGNTLTRPGVSGAQTLTWNAEGRLAAVAEGGKTTTNNVYDVDGNRLLRRDATGTTLYLPGMEVRWASGTSATTCTRYYTFGGKTVASRTGGAVAELTWLVSDHQGTQSVAVNAATQAVTVRRQTPYGERRGAAASWPNSRGFVGGETDPTGLVHIGARQYDSALGRFISGDPVQDLQDPQQWNAYAYAHNSPITFSDPTGLRDLCGHNPGDACERGPKGGGSSGGGSSGGGSSGGGSSGGGSGGQGGGAPYGNGSGGAVSACASIRVCEREGEKGPWYTSKAPTVTLASNWEEVYTSLVPGQCISGIDGIHPCHDFGPMAWVFDAVNYSKVAGIDPRLLLAVLMLEIGPSDRLSVADDGFQAAQLLAYRHGIYGPAKKAYAWATGDRKCEVCVPSIGWGNIQEEAFLRTKLNHPDALRNVEWSDLIGSDSMSIMVTAYRLADAEKFAESNNTALLRSQYSQGEVAAAIYNVGENGLMAGLNTRGTLGPDATKYTNIIQNNLPDADWLICGSGVFVCS